MKELKDKYYLLITLWLERNAGGEVKRFDDNKSLTLKTKKGYYTGDFILSKGKTNWVIPSKDFITDKDILVVYHPNISTTKEDLIILHKNKFVKAILDDKVKYSKTTKDGVQYVILGDNAIDKFMFAKRLKQKDD